VVSEYSSSTALNAEPKPGNVYLVEEKRPRASYELFEQTLGYGYSGLILTRDFPKKLMNEKEFGGCKVLWLTNLVGDGRINPTAIGILMSQIRAFIESQPRSAVIFDGLEYLISLNTYDRMLQFMNQLRDIVATNECVFLVPVDPRTLSERELALLERNLEPIVPKSDADASEEHVLSTENGEIRLLDVGRR
jgi:hypothetical protein